MSGRTSPTAVSSAKSRSPSIDEENVLPPPKENPAADPYLVDWEEGDKENPRMWSTTYKALITFQLGMLAMSASLGSSIIAPAENAIASYLQISPEVNVLGVSLFVLGFAFGPMMWAPISEIWGRRFSLLPAMFCLGIFSIGTAVSQTAASIFVTRFFGGIFGSAPVSNVSAAMGDLYDPKARGIAITFYAVSAFAVILCLWKQLTC
jgi:MFS family permease